MENFIIPEGIVNRLAYQKIKSKVDSDFIEIMLTLNKHNLMNGVSDIEIQLMLIQHMMVAGTFLTEHFINHANYLKRLLENGQEIEIYEWIDECEKVQRKVNKLLKHEYSEEYILNLYKSVKQNNINPLMKKRVI